MSELWPSGCGNKIHILSSDYFQIVKYFVLKQSDIKYYLDISVFANSS